MFGKRSAYNFWLVKPSPALPGRGEGNWHEGEVGQPAGGRKPRSLHFIRYNMGKFGKGPRKRFVFTGDYYFRNFFVSVVEKRNETVCPVWGLAPWVRCSKNTWFFAVNALLKRGFLKRCLALRAYKQAFLPAENTGNREEGVDKKISCIVERRFY